MCSRGVKLRLSLPPNASLPRPHRGQCFSTFLQTQSPAWATLWQKKLSLHELTQQIQAQGSQDFLALALHWCQAQLTRFEQCEHLLQLVRFTQEQQLYHGRRQTQLALWVTTIRELSPPQS